MSEKPNMCLHSVLRTVAAGADIRRDELKPKLAERKRYFIRIIIKIRESALKICSFCFVLFCCECDHVVNSFGIVFHIYKMIMSISAHINDLMNGLIIR